jgi:hypothetical protein
MSEFKISPVTQCKMKPKPHFLLWFFAAIVIVETIAGSYWFFRLNDQIAKLKQQINTMQAIENEEQTNV